MMHKLFQLLVSVVIASLDIINLVDVSFRLPAIIGKKLAGRLHEHVLACSFELLVINSVSHPSMTTSAIIHFQASAAVPATTFYLGTLSCHVLAENSYR